MEDLPGEDKVGKNMDGRIFFVPNHPGVSTQKSSMMVSYLQPIILQHSITK
jgi:hypothetical protein